VSFVDEDVGKMKRVGDRSNPEADVWSVRKSRRKRVSGVKMGDASIGRGFRRSRRPMRRDKPCQSTQVKQNNVGLLIPRSVFLRDDACMFRIGTEPRFFPLSDDPLTITTTTRPKCRPHPSHLLGSPLSEEASQVLRLHWRC